MGDCFLFMKASKTTGIWSRQRVCNLEIVFQSRISGLGQFLAPPQQMPLAQLPLQIPPGQLPPRQKPPETINPWTITPWTPAPPDNYPLDLKATEFFFFFFLLINVCFGG